MSKLYTRTGDDGSTSLIGGKRVPKCHPRVMAYGKVDELMAHIAVIRSLIAQPPYDALPCSASVDAELLDILQELMTVASCLASEKPHSTVSLDTISRMEAAIDDRQRSVPPLTHFILPGGSSASAYTHVARTVCRECERLAVAIGPESAPTNVLTYLNRLSDYLFVLARFLCIATNCKEEFWGK